MSNSQLWCTVLTPELGSGSADAPVILGQLAVGELMVAVTVEAALLGPEIHTTNTYGRVSNKTLPWSVKLKIALLGDKMATNVKFITSCLVHPWYAYYTQRTPYKH